MPKSPALRLVPSRASRVRASYRPFCPIRPPLLEVPEPKIIYPGPHLHLGFHYPIACKSLSSCDLAPHGGRTLTTAGQLFGVRGPLSGWMLRPNPQQTRQIRTAGRSLRFGFPKHWERQGRFFGEATTIFGNKIQLYPNWVPDSQIVRLSSVLTVRGTFGWIIQTRSAILL